MIKWLAIVTAVLYLVSHYYSRRFMLQEGHDERGKLILYKSRSKAFPFILAGWATLYFINVYHHLTYPQFQNAVVLVVTGVYLIQFIYLLIYRRQY
ncbi:hypothetical protein SD51_13040 [Alicyclobacillus tengchongensis]|uniref:Uncharacterized protein n=1 Tax=Alicyclobacillus tolerans TaxID=90970 RepID=A0A1M6WXV6_9BACL|nr:hypothetical protein [Alicyclobacillus montanus]KRW90731.1 hypothetical protein SD51_13040 [Alicyclobacillus tengchongensis]SHK98547.1 hypothetical protein SAMN05443507_13023 [Alicyclobacillus montanus]